MTFESTYYRRYSDGTHHYLIEEMLGLDPHERFTEEAEVVVLTEALKTSYAEAARTLPSRQEISKTRRVASWCGIRRRRLGSVRVTDPDLKKTVS